MNKYQKVIDYEKHEAKFFGNINGITMEVSKDIIIDDYEKEIERLNNIIDELEKWLEEYSNECGIDERITLKMIGDKLKELKEGK